MTPGLSVVLLCGSDPSRIVDSLRSLDGSRAIELVIAAEASTPAAALPWLRALAARWHGVFEEGASSEGAARNAGLARTSSELCLCLHAGDRVHPDGLSRAISVLADDPAVAFAAAVNGAKDLQSDACELTLQMLVADFDVLQPAVLFRRADWVVLGGFDADLSALSDTDFWLRSLESGRRGVLLDTPVAHTGAANVARRLATRQDTGLVERLVVKRRAAFERFALEALEAREVRLLEQAPAYQKVRGDWERDTAELQRLQEAIAHARERLGGAPEIAFGDLRRVTPISRDWGYERGEPIDRWFIERFLAAHAEDIRGSVLEIQEGDYTKRFGGERVSRSEVLDLNAANPAATILADLRDAPHIPDDQFDCIILTQTIHVVDDMRAVAAECHRILKPGGVLLATLPCVSRTCLEYGRDGDFWRVTDAGARALFGAVFGADVQATPRGNVLASTAFIFGLARNELREEELAHDDPYNPTIACVRARKEPAAGAPGRARGRHLSVGEGQPAGAILLYHRVCDLAGDVHGLAVPPQAFREQMQYVRERFRVVPLNVLAREAAERRLTAGTVAVTFDDGYEDNLVQASPVLLELGIPATFFLTTSSIDGPFEYWWDRLARALTGGHAVPDRLHVTLPDGQRELRTSTPEERNAAHAAIYAAIVHAPVDLRDEVVSRVVEWSGVTAFDSSNARLTRQGIVELAGRPGHSIGAHTVNHLSLPHQPATVVADELRPNRQALEALTGARVSELAYPFGAYDLRTMTSAGEAGFTTAVTCDAELVRAGTNPLSLPRLDAAADGIATLATLRRSADAGAARSS